MQNLTTIPTAEIVATKPFVTANTEEVNIQLLENDCIIPVFAKDNERTISHQEFITVAQDSLSQLNMKFQVPEIRVSHQIKGRIPEAIHKNVKDLLDHEKTQYFERMAFVIRIPEITDTINGNKLALTIGGVRAYNQQNLYAKKTMEKFKFFIGFQNMVCCNLCVSSDGYVGELKVGSLDELGDKILQIIRNYDAENHLSVMKELVNYDLSEHEFAQLIGRSKLYGFLPKAQKALIPALDFNDSHLTTMAKDYYTDHEFSCDSDGSINLWNVYNLFTQANKNSYIDTILDRSVNALEFSQGLQRAKQGSPEYEWFIK